MRQTLILIPFMWEDTAREEKQYNVAGKNKTKEKKNHIKHTHTHTHKEKIYTSVLSCVSTAAKGLVAPLAAAAAAAMFDDDDDDGGIAAPAAAMDDDDEDEEWEGWAKLAVAEPATVRRGAWMFLTRISGVAGIVLLEGRGK